MTGSVIVGGARTPFGRLGGGLSTVDATELGGIAIRATLERAGVEPSAVENVIFGQVLEAGQGQIPSRQAQIRAGIPRGVPSETVNKVCASSMRAVGMADQYIRAGDLDVAVAGGMESMSTAPYLLKKARFGYRMGDGSIVDAMVHDGLTNPFSGKHMGLEAGDVAEELGVAREDMDGLALLSHQRAVAAADRLAEEIAPVTVKGRKGETTVDADEGPRADTTLERLAGLRGAFGQGGTHTAGNSSSVNDGAAALVVTSEEWAKDNGIEPWARIVAQGAVADEFAYLARTPAGAAKQALDRAGMGVGDVDLFEINEAFASVVVNSMRMLGIDSDRVNVNGGAIALGHPIGASGARIVLTLVQELRRRGGGIGCAAICSGGGQGDALLLDVRGA